MPEITIHFFLDDEALLGALAEDGEALEETASRLLSEALDKAARRAAAMLLDDFGEARH